MNAYIIYIQGHEDSEKFSDRCLRSIIDTESDLTVEKFPAITPENMWKVNYTWPLRKKIKCPKTGLLLSAYKTYDNNKRIAAAQSHYMLWRKCVTENKPIMILEHDAIFTKKFESTFAYCEKPPKYDSPTLNPVRITFSSFLNLESSLSVMVPEKSIPGTKGNFLTIFPPLFKIKASL